MIELIFVIVILGILASVAIPKLAATRDDAKISKLATNIQTAKNEIVSSIVATGTIPDDLADVSNVIKELDAAGYADSTTTNKKVVFKAENNGAKEDCVTFDLTNGTQLKVTHEAGSGAICAQVKSMVPAVDVDIKGKRVTF